jgi:hypothetical protein
MTREEAIEFIAQSVKSDVDMAKVADAIKALEQESTIEEEYEYIYIGNGAYEKRPKVKSELTTKNDLGVDCISRDGAIKALDYDIKYFEFKSGVSKHMDDIAKLLNTIYETQVNNIKALPPVTPIIPKGHWITKDGKEQGYDIAGVKTWYIQIICSECGFIKPAIEGHTEQYHFCPRCGADMREVEE